MYLKDLKEINKTAYVRLIEFWSDLSRIGFAEAKSDLILDMNIYFTKMVYIQRLNSYATALAALFAFLGLFSSSIIGFTVAVEDSDFSCSWIIPCCCCYCSIAYYVSYTSYLKIGAPIFVTCSILWKSLRVSASTALYPWYRSMRPLSFSRFLRI